MDYQEVVKQITPELYQTFKRSLELGKWPDGRQMSVEQKQHCLQAVIAYDALHTPKDQRVGHVDAGPKACASDAPATLRWASDSDAGDGSEGEST